VRIGAATGTPTLNTIIDVRGLHLVGFHDVAEDACAQFTPVSHAIVYACTPHGVVLVRNRETAAWELPGGLIEHGDTMRMCAVREFLEETGEQPRFLRWCGLTELKGISDRRHPQPYVEIGAVYGVDLTHLQISGYRTTEIAEVAIWPVMSLPDRMSSIDAEIVNLFI
jgi:8-oxo-dGTP diphosphatase